MPTERAGSFAEFWPLYLRAHSRRGNRLLHGLGTVLACCSLVAAVMLSDWRFAWLAPVLGYGLAWSGHAALEGNRPATFRHPWWSLAADFRMLGLALSGRLGRELRRHLPRSDGG